MYVNNVVATIVHWYYFVINMRVREASNVTMPPRRDPETVDERHLYNSVVPLLPQLTAAGEGQPSQVFHGHNHRQPRHAPVVAGR